MTENKLRPDIKAALLACADDLEQSIEAAYQHLGNYPMYMRKKDGDLQTVRRARDAIALLDGDTWTVTRAGVTTTDALE